MTGTQKLATEKDLLFISLGVWQEVLYHVIDLG